MPSDGNASPRDSINLRYYRQKRYGRVLELGPYDGRDTVDLAPCCEHLIAIEGREENVRKTEQTLQTNGVDNVTVLHGNIESYDLVTMGVFACVWASGIIYHLPHPIQLIGQITRVTSMCYGWTHLAQDALNQHDGYSGCWYAEVQCDVAGLSERSWWFTPEDFLRAWQDLGWMCGFTTMPMPHFNGGLAAQFIAMK